MSYDNSPSVIQKILQKYTYTQKTYLVAIITGCLIIFLSFLILSKMVIESQFAKREAVGIQYLKIVYPLLNDITKFKVNATTPTSLSTKNIQDKIDVQFHSLIEFHEKFMHDSSIKNLERHFPEVPKFYPQDIFNEWKDSLSPLKDQSIDKKNAIYSNIIDHLQDLLLSIADESNLTFDQEIKTHYLIGATLNSLPEELDLTSRLIVQVEELEKDPAIKKYEIQSFSSLLLSNIATTKRSVERALNHSKNTKKRDVYNELIEYVDAAELFTAHLKTEILKIQTEPSELNSQIEESQNKHIPLGISVLEKNNTMWTMLSNILESDLKERIDQINRNRLILTSLIVFIVSFAFGIGFIVISETNRFFNEVYKTSMRFSKGELHARLPPSYDAAFEKTRLIVNELGDRIESLIQQLQHAGVQLTTTTTEIAAAARHQEGTVGQQEATVKEVLMAVSDISCRAKEFAKTMNEISSSAEQTSMLATTGKKDLTEMEEAMRLMINSSKSIASKLAVLNEKASNITSVITTITKVADQTNMLSFNASIEAEKAGPHGKSFVVIAREIRRLADQTANATLDIEQMVSEIMSAVTEGVVGVGKFAEDIQHGANDVSKISEQLSSIINQVQQQTRSYEYVNKGMQAQSEGAEKINDAILQLNDAAQETTTSIRQFHAAIEQLTIASKEMQTFVSKMKG